MANPLPSTSCRRHDASDCARKSVLCLVRRPVRIHAIKFAGALSVNVEGTPSKTTRPN
jgi:hypothetical protein